MSRLRALEPICTTTLQVIMFTVFLATCSAQKCMCSHITENFGSVLVLRDSAGEQLKITRHRFFMCPFQLACTQASDCGQSLFFFPHLFVTRIDNVTSQHLCFSVQSAARCFEDAVQDVCREWRMQKNSLEGPGSIIKGLHPSVDLCQLLLHFHRHTRLESQ